MNEPAAEQVESPQLEALPKPVGFGLWLAGCLLASAVLVAVSHVAQQYSAPLLLFPLLVGFTLGSCSAYLLSVLGLQRRLLTAVCLALVAFMLTVGQHAAAYNDYLRQFEEARRANPKLLIYEKLQGRVEPMSFGSFLELEARRGRRLGQWQLVGWQVWASWVLDAAAIVGGALIAHRVLTVRRE